MSNTGTIKVYNETQLVKIIAGLVREGIVHEVEPIPHEIREGNNGYKIILTGGY